MIKYPVDYNPILRYWQQIREGKVTVGKKIYKTYQKLAYDVEHPGEWHYSTARANHILEFAENFCRQSKGEYGGKLVRLELWEKALLAAIFGFINDEGTREYREAVLIVGKKNGKSLIASIVGLYMFMADGEKGPEVYAVATKKDQAKIVWGEGKKMVLKSPQLRSRTRPHVADIVCDINDGVFKPLASDSDTLDGLNVHCGLMDEIHQWKNGKALYDIIADGVAARKQPLIFMTSTAGTIREDIYDDKYDYASMVINGYGDEKGYKDDRFIAFIYELDQKSEWTDEACWYKANPGLGTIKNLTILREKVEQAKQDSRKIKNLVCKEFNIRETSTQAWLTFDQLNCTDTFKLDRAKNRLFWTRDGHTMELPYPRYGVGGVDLSSTTDLTAAKVLFMVPGCDKIFTLQMYWMPEDLVQERVREDKIPYDLWIEQGYMRTCPGNKNHYKYVTEWFKEVHYDLDIYIFRVGYDAWSARYFVDEMKYEFGESTMQAVIQGKKTLSDPMKKLGADLEAKLIIYNNNPIDKWCLANTSYEEDRNGNIQPKKTTKRTRRIDGMATLLDGYVALQDNMEEYLSNL